MSKTAKAKNNGWGSLYHMTERNKEKVGDFLRGLLEKDLSVLEERVVSFFARSKAYRDNNIPKLLELANDIKIWHQARINFVEKYAGDLFAKNPTKLTDEEKEQVEFLENEIIPFLQQQVKQKSS